MSELEEKLRELRVWTKFKKNYNIFKKSHPGYQKLDVYLQVEKKNPLLSAFLFKDTPEGQDFWWEIEKKWASRYR